MFNLDVMAVYTEMCLAKFSLRLQQLRYCSYDKTISCNNTIVKQFTSHRCVNSFEKFCQQIKGAFVWVQSGIRIIGIMRVRVCLGAILISEYLDFHSGYSAPGSRIAGIYSRKYSYSRIFPTERALK